MGSAAVSYVLALEDIAALQEVRLDRAQLDSVGSCKDAKTNEGV